MVFIENTHLGKVDACPTSTTSLDLKPQDEAIHALLQQTAEALKLATEPLGSGDPSTENNTPEDSNPILADLLASIDTNALINEESAESVAVVLKTASSQLDAIDDLKSEIAALNRELGKNLTPQQIADLEAQLAKLASAYKNAKSQKDIDAAIAGIEALEKQYPSLKGPLDAIIACMKNGKDPSSAFAALKASLDAMSKEDASLTSQIATLQAQVSSLEASVAGDLQKIEGLILKFGNDHSHLKDLELLLSLRTLITDLSHVKITDRSHKNENLKGSEKSVHYEQDLFAKRRGLVEG